MELSTTQRVRKLLGHSIVSQHFIEPEGSTPNSQERSTCVMLSSLVLVVSEDGQLRQKYVRLFNLKKNSVLSLS
jgi:hypothetical protein